MFKITDVKFRNEVGKKATIYYATLDTPPREERTTINQLATSESLTGFLLQIMVTKKRGVFIADFSKAKGSLDEASGPYTLSGHFDGEPPQLLILPRVGVHLELYPLVKQR
jgi:hypothetical protein